jgi:hypothetical protein
MTKPTGRPRGRPKTKEYVTLMARVDVALADRVKRYASLHRQPLSVVLRDALTLLMDEYPSGADLRAPHRVAEHEFLSDRYESPLDTLVGEIDSASLDELLSDSNKAAMAIIDADAASEREYLSDTNKEEDILSGASTGEAIMSDIKEVPTALASDTNEELARVASGINAKLAQLFSPNPRKGRATKAVPTPIMSDTKADDADFNSTTHLLGKLCPRKHEYRGTGQSVLRISNRHCRACDREKFHERPAKRQAQCHPLVDADQ